MFRIVLLLAIATATLVGAQAPQCSGVLPGTNPLLTRWPYLLSTTDRSTVLAFGTSTNVTETAVVLSLDGRVVVEARATFELIDATGVTLNLFRAYIAGLQAKTTYCYNVYATVEGRQIELAGALSFTTAPLSNTTDIVRFVAIGDFGAGTPGQRRVRDAIFSRIDQADMFIALGDDVYLTGTHFAYQRFNFEVYYEQWAVTPLFLTSGNHDYYANGAASYLQNFFQFVDQETVEPAARGRYFSWDWAQVHFVSVDTEQELDKPADAPTGMIRWLESDLAATTKPWKIIVLHKVPYTEGRVADSRVIEKLVPVFEKYGVQVVMGGHWHDYQRFPPLIGQTVVPTSQGGVTYIVTGGGGFPVIGDIIPQVKGNSDYGFSYDPNSISHNVKDDTGERVLRTIEPDFYKAVQHFSYVEIGDCTFTIQAIDSDRVVFDDFTIDRCV